MLYPLLCCCVAQQFIRIKKTDIDEYIQGTEYLKKDDVHQKLKIGFNSQMENIKNNEIEDPIKFTSKVLKQLAIMSFEKTIKECETFLNSFSKYNEITKKDKMDEQNKQKRNYLIKEELQKQKDIYFSNLNVVEKRLYRLMELLQQMNRMSEKPKKESKSLIQETVYEKNKTKISQHIENETYAS